MSSLASLVAVLAPSLIVAIIFFALFCYLRASSSDLCRRVLSPRTSLFGLDAPPLPGSLLGWISGVLDVSRDRFIECAGLDAFVYVRFMKAAMQIFAVSTLIGLAAVLPVNATGGNDGVSGLDSLTMAGIPDESARLWAPALFLWVVSAAFFYFVKQALDEIIPAAQFFKAKAARNAYTVLVEDVPVEQRSQRDLELLFQRLYPNEFVAASMALDVSKLDKSVEELIEAQRGLQHAKAVLAQADSEDAERPTHGPGTCGFCPCASKVDSIEYYSDAVETKSAEVQEVRTQVDSGDHDLQTSASGFVTFRSMRTAALAAGGVQHSLTPGTWKVRTAPEPRDVYFPSLNLDPIVKAASARAVFVMVAVLIVFWTIPVAFVTSLNNLDDLADQLPFLEPVTELPASIKGLIQGLLPTVLLAVLMSLLPIILRIFAVRRGETSYSAIEGYVMSQYFVFNVVQVFLVATLSGTVFKSLDQIVNEPSSAVSLLAEALPAFSAFFISYVALRGLAEFPAALLRLGPLIVTHIKLKYLTKTELDEREAQEPGAFDYGMSVPAHMLIFVLGVSYSSIAPLILPFALIYFSFAYLVGRYQLLYVYTPRYESGGSSWPRIFKYAYVGVLIAQLTTIGVISLKKGVQGPILLPLPFVSYAFFNHFDKLYSEVLRTSRLSLEAAVDGDAAAEVDDEHVQALHWSYKSPSLLIPIDELLESQLVSQAERCVTHPQLRKPVVQNDDERELPHLAVGDEPAEAAEPV